MTNLLCAYCGEPTDNADLLCDTCDDSNAFDCSAGHEFTQCTASVSVCVKCNALEGNA